MASGQRAEIPNPQSLIPNPLFAVRTPTATVTDLGTEFGVEVSKEGHTISHVFRGVVRVQVVPPTDKAEAMPKSCTKTNRPAWRIAVSSGDNRAIVFVPASKPANFVREIPKRTIKSVGPG